MLGQGGQVGVIATGAAGSRAGRDVRMVEVRRRRFDGSHGFGEAAFGVYVETGAASVPDGTAWMISVGISLRTPVLAGLACCRK
jgi:hypothetical protein